MNNLDMDILIQTERLYLRKLATSDRDMLHRIFCDSEMMTYLGEVWTEELTDETLSEWQAAWKQDNYCYGVMVERSTNEPVGVAGISEDTNQSEPGIEFAWFVLPECQGKGYATEITRGLLGYVFEVLKKDRFIAETHPDNPGANRVLEKVGFKMVGEKHNSYDYLPDFDRQVVWEFLRDNWSG